MASTVDYVFDPYVADSYAPADFVNDPFIEDGFVSAVITGSASLAAQATSSVNGGLLLEATTSQSAQTTQSATPTVTRTFTSTINAVASVQTDGDAKRVGTSSSSAVFSVSSAGVQTKRSSATFDGAGSASIFAVATVSPGADVSVSATLSSFSGAIRPSSATLASTTEDTRWQDPYSWDWPGLIWGPNFIVSAIKSVGATLTYNLQANATLSADGDVTAVANITAESFATQTTNAVKVVDASASLSSAFTQTTQAQVAYDIVNQVISASASLSASGIYQVGSGPIAVSASFAQSANAIKTASGISTQSSQATQATSGNRIRFGVTEINAHPKTDLQSVIDITDFYTVTGRLQFVSTGVWRRAIEIQSDSDANIIDTDVINTHIFRITVAPGIYTFGFEQNTINRPQGFNDVYWYNITDSKEIVRQEYTDTGDDVEADAIEKTVAFTQNTTLEIRATGTFANLNIGTIEPFVKQTTTNLSANADRIADGIVLQASAGTLSADAEQTKGPYQLELTGVFTQSCNGGRLRDGSATFNAFNSVLSALTIFNIDPFRVYTVPIESRIAVIEQDTRIFNLKSENRVNTIEAETRTNQVPSESRYLVVQPLRLVEEAGTLDRRVG